MEANQKVRVLHVLPSLSGGGAERCVLDVMGAIDSSRFDCALALLSPGGEYWKQLPEGFTVHSLKGLTGRSNSLRLADRLEALCSELHIDIIHSQLTSANRTILRAATKRRLPARVVVSEQNNLYQNMRRIKNPVKRCATAWEIRRLYRKSHALVAVSHGVAECVKRFVPGASDIQVLYNPVDLKKVARNLPPGGTLRNEAPWSLVTLGRLVPQKGYDDLIAAVAQVRKQVDVRLTILGEGPLRSDLERQIAILGLEGSVKMPGFAENPWSDLAQGDLYVSSSRWEGFPLAVLEAIACDLPLVITDCDYGPREIIKSGVSGELVPVGDIEATVAAIVAVLGDRAKRARYIRNARESLEPYRIESVARAYAEFYERLLR